MKAVFEEVNGEYAVLLLEELKRTYSIPQKELPSGAKIGDIFEVELTAQNEIQFQRKLLKERSLRENGNRAKREALKRRSRKNS